MRYRAGLVALIMVCCLPAKVHAQRPDDRVEFGHDVVVGPGEEIGDTVCVGCSIRVSGAIHGDAVAIGGRIEVDGTAQGDIVAVGGGARLGSAARVNGDVLVVGGRIDRDPHAEVGGEFTTVPGLPVAGLQGLIILGLLLFSGLNIVLVLIVYLISGERRAEVLASTVRTSAARATVAGLGVLVAASMLFFVSFLLGPVKLVLIIGIPVALLISLLVGYTGISLWLGRTLAKGTKPLLAVLLGAVLLTLLQSVPFFGLLACLAFFLLALGSAVLSGFGSGPDWLSQHVSSRPMTQ